MGKSMLKMGKAERAELYKDRDTQVLISKFLNGEISELKPTFDPKFGYRYPIVEEILGEASNGEKFLNRLYEAGILERKLYDKIIYCPSCRSQNVSTQYCCPYCKSFNIKKGSLIEHVKCGYMDVEENFRKGNRLVCPKCHQELKKSEVDYRRAGIWCTCRDCGKSFDIPVPRHFCRDCQNKFAFEELEVKDVYAYSLKEEVRSEISAGWIFIAPIREFLLESGFEVETPAFLKGRSGAKHMFDIAASHPEKKSVMVMDLATSTQDIVPEQPVIALFAKIYDVSPESAYLIAIPKLSENGKKMAELYNIKVIEAKDAKEATKALTKVMTAK